MAKEWSGGLLRTRSSRCEDKPGLTPRLEREEDRNREYPRYPRQDIQRDADPRKVSVAVLSDFVDEHVRLISKWRGKSSACGHHDRHEKGSRAGVQAVGHCDGDRRKQHGDSGIGKK